MSSARLRNHISTWVTSLGALCQQGNEIRVHLLSGRCAAIFLLIFSALIHKFYTSVLISKLVESFPEAEYTDLRTLADSDISVGFRNSNIIRVLFHVSFQEN